MAGSFKKNAGSVSAERKAVAAALYDFLGPAAKEAGQLIAEQVRLYRWRLATKIMRRAEAYAKERGISPKSIPYNFLVPFIEKASLADDNRDIVDYWANLLVDASQETGTKHRVFLDVLSAIDRNQAIMLRSLFLDSVAYSENILGSKDIFSNVMSKINHDVGDFLTSVSDPNAQNNHNHIAQLGFDSLRRWWKERRIPGVIRRTSCGFAGHIPNPRYEDFDELRDAGFDIFHLCTLQLLTSETSNL